MLNCKLYVPFAGFLWSIQDKHQLLEVRENGTEVFYSSGNELAVVKGDKPILRQGQFYFEVCIENTGQNSKISVGICTKSHPLDSHPGWEPNSFGYHGDDGNIYCESGSPTYCPEKPFKPGSIIGVLLDFNKSTLTFSREQKEVQIIQLQSRHMNQDYYPCVGNRSPGAVIRLTKPIAIPKSGTMLNNLVYSFLSNKHTANLNFPIK